MTSLQQTAMLGGAASAKTASYTLVAADAGTAISMTSASATTITVNTGLFAAGDTVQITNLGAGVCTITAGTATVNTSASLALAQYESGTLNFTSTSAAIFIKSAGAASGGMTLLSTTNLSATTTTISSISGAYNNLLLIISGASWATFNTSYSIRPNGSSTGSFGGYVVNNAGSYGSTGFEDSSINSFNDNIPANNANNVVAYTFFNYANTSYFKAFHGVGYFNKSSSGCTFNVGGGFKSNSAITSFDIVLGQATTYTGGVALLYGVK
jgi:hypothetical protein